MSYFYETQNPTIVEIQSPDGKKYYLFGVKGYESNVSPKKTFFSFWGGVRIANSLMRIVYDYIRAYKSGGVQKLYLRKRMKEITLPLHYPYVYGYDVFFKNRKGGVKNPIKIKFNFPLEDFWKMKGSIGYGVYAASKRKPEFNEIFSIFAKYQKAKEALNEFEKELFEKGIKYFGDIENVFSFISREEDKKEIREFINFIEELKNKEEQYKIYFDFSIPFAKSDEEYIKFMLKHDLHPSLLVYDILRKIYWNEGKIKDKELLKLLVENLLENDSLRKTIFHEKDYDLNTYFASRIFILANKNEILKIIDELVKKGNPEKIKKLKRFKKETEDLIRINQAKKDLNKKLSLFSYMLKKEDLETNWKKFLNLIVFTEEVKKEEQLLSFMEFFKTLIQNVNTKEIYLFANENNALSESIKVIKKRNEKFGTAPNLKKIKTFYQVIKEILPFLKNKNDIREAENLLKILENLSPIPFEEIGNLKPFKFYVLKNDENKDTYKIYFPLEKSKRHKQNPALVFTYKKGGGVYVKGKKINGYLEERETLNDNQVKKLLKDNLRKYLKEVLKYLYENIDALLNNFERKKATETFLNIPFNQEDEMLKVIKKEGERLTNYGYK